MVGDKAIEDEHEGATFPPEEVASMNAPHGESFPVRYTTLKVLELKVNPITG